MADPDTIVGSSVLISTWGRRPDSRRDSHRRVTSSAGRNVSMASSLAATSSGVPNVETVE